ncbi:PaeR7I family type II restriction endonuclease, partial [Micromonospora sp. NPDC050980]|uniref:PaeR7I family type II restriction endonuclease n=1 Tax=Micromonospora sp. NPDC050980 TaxID=3155161 RepID=UPI00340581BD
HAHAARRGTSSVRASLVFLQVSMSPSNPGRNTFRTDPAFAKTSYIDRYVILCKRLRSAGLYDATCLVTSSREADAPIRQPDAEIGFSAFAGAIMARTEEFGVGPLY